MADVASAAGVSRGTIYNEFRSRRGLAGSYALRLTDTIVTGMRTAIDDHEGDGYGAMRTVSVNFSTASPTTRWPRCCEPRTPHDILRLITVYSQFLVDHAAQQLSTVFQRSWVNANEDDAEVMGQAVVRAALSFVALLPGDADEATKGMARLLAPSIESIGT